MAASVANRFFVFVLVAAVSFPLGAAEIAADIGSPAPAWGKLPGVDGQNHALDDLNEAKVVVVVFTCNSCPYAVDYEDRLREFDETYRGRGVRLVAINVNTEPEDDLEHMKQRASEKGFAFPYLFDATQQIGSAYGAKVTPHCFVLDGERKIAYQGGFDDARKPAKVTRHYVRDAVEALLAGKRPEVTTTRPAGCSIRYED